MKRVYLVFLITLITTLSFLGSCSLDRGDSGSDLESENNRAIKYIRPSGAKRSDAKIFYEKWKDAFVKTSTTVDTQKYVEMVGNPPSLNWKSTSEACGYGMIFALTFDDEDTFEGLFKFAERWRSTTNNKLYAWAFPKNESNPPALQGSATDGDVHIAYALLCAAKKWGNNNYKIRAIEIVKALETLIQVPSEWYFLVTGDWTLTGNERLKRITRPSDFALAEFRAFIESHATASIWSCVLEDAVSFVSRYQKDYSPNCGLVADWMEWNIQKSIFVAPEEKFIKDNFGEDEASKYSWNACRIPLRFAVDALLYNNTRAKEALKPLVDFMIKQAKTRKNGRTTYDVTRIKAGYTMSGSAIVNYDDASFWAPVVAAARVFATSNNEYKAFMDAGYPKVRDSFDGISGGPHDSYYDDSIALLCLILLNDLWYDPLK